jgi:hypothetical protein
MDRPNSNPARDYVGNSIASDLEESGRTEARVWTILRVAKISFADRRALCRVRNISPNGLMAEASTQLASGDRLSIELRDGLALTGTVERRVALRDISQRGAKFDHDVQFAAGLPIKIMVDGYRELRGFIRWSRDGQVGVEFADCIPNEELDGKIYTRWVKLALAESPADG